MNLLRRFDAHERAVLLPLCLVGFFTNYDTGLLALAAPVLADGLGVSVAAFGIAVAVIRLGALGSLVTLRLADRWGRRPLLLVSVLAFTALTGLTALAWSIVVFTALQLLARLFLATEEGLAGVVLSEELRPDRRGAGIGLLGILATSGFGLVAVLLLVVDSTPLGWRLLYVVALLPLLVVVHLRRRMGETTAYLVAPPQPARWWPDLDDASRARLRRLLLLVALAGASATTSFFYAAERALDGYGWTGLFTVVVLAAAPTTLLGYLVGGRLSDRFGRRPITAGAVVAAGAGVALLFLGGPALFAPGFFLMAGADAALHAVRAAYASELFPTRVRATVAALVGAVTVASGSAGLVLAGVLAGPLDALPADRTALLLAAAAALGALLLRRLPETAGADLVGAPVVPPVVPPVAAAEEPA